MAVLAVLTAVVAVLPLPLQPTRPTQPLRPPRPSPGPTPRPQRHIKGQHLWFILSCPVWLITQHLRSFRYDFFLGSNPEFQTRKLLFMVYLFLNDLNFRVLKLPRKKTPLTKCLRSLRPLLWATWKLPLLKWWIITKGNSVGYTPKVQEWTLPILCHK